MFTDMLMLWSFGYAKTKFDVDFEKRSEARCVRVCPTHVAGGLACIACAPQKYVGPRICFLDAPLRRSVETDLWPTGSHDLYIQGRCSMGCGACGQALTGQRPFFGCSAVQAPGICTAVP